MKVAICYDRVNKFGGAERVLQALHEMFPDAPLYTLTYSPEGARWAEGWDIRTSFLQKIPIISKRHELFPPLASLAWEQFRFDEFDLVISVTSAEAKSILVPPHTKHVCYCLTPTRYYWSGYYDYVKEPGFGKLNWLVRTLFPLWACSLRVYDFFHAQRPDVMVGISDEVCRRIKKYYRREAIKVYPPVEVKSLDEKSPQKKKYFLVVSRLVPYKRVDIVIEVFNQLGWPLKIVGIGSELDRLKAMAQPNVVFEGFVDDTDLPVLYSEAIALIFPTFEDFGISPVEAQGYGLPVVAYGKGGAVETVIEGETGIFFAEQTAVCLRERLESITKGKDLSLVVRYFEQFSGEKCHLQAQRFSKTHFYEQIRLIVASLSSL